MATVQKIYEEMQRMAPLELAESWDNPGLLVDCGGEVSRVLVALDVTAETMAEAEQNGCQLIVTADCLLTGEANHHHAIDAKRLGLSLIAAGHYATEFPVTAAVAEKLRAAFPAVEVLVSTANGKPVELPSSGPGITARPAVRGGRPSTRDAGGLLCRKGPCGRLRTKTELHKAVQNNSACTVPNWYDKEGQKSPSRSTCSSRPAKISLQNYKKKQTAARMLVENRPHLIGESTPSAQTKNCWRNER